MQMDREPPPLSLPELRNLIRAHMASSPEGMGPLRETFETLAELVRPAEIPAEVAMLREPSVLGEWLSTTPDPKGTILYLHGGGFIYGSARSHRHLAAALGKECSMDVLTLDYRLAPENPFPAALEDALAALDYIQSKGCPPEKIVVMGDSAGGGLAISLLSHLRDAGQLMPAAAALISPWLDLTVSTDSVVRNAGTDPFAADPEFARQVVALYAGPNIRADDPRVSPLHGSPAGLPRFYIMVGGGETFLDEAVTYSENALSKGANVELKIFEDMFHIWPFFYKYLPQGREAIRDIGSFVRGILP